MHGEHRKAAEQHVPGAQVHRTAAEHNANKDGIPANWHQTRALEYSDQANKLAAEPLDQRSTNKGVPKKINCWFLPVLFGTAFVGQAVCATAPAALQISTEAAPAGGWAQIKIYAAKPMAIASGHLVLSFDPTAFGNGAMVGLFGANGDAAGLATVTWPRIDVQFSSATGGIGQLAGLRVVVISVPVLASAAGRTVAVSATSPDSSVSVASGSVKVQGTLSVEKIPAGTGVVAAGTVVPVYGKGFTASTTVTIDGVAITSARFISAEEIDVIIGGGGGLVGKTAG